MFRRSLGMASLCAAMTGCYAEATTGADVEYGPPVANVEVYPHEYYDGRVVYLVGDRWYYHDGPRWVYYRSEPPVLYQRRVVIHQAPVVRERAEVRRAPPAPRRYYSAPPARPAPPVRAAPPAHVERHEHREYRE